MKKFILPLIAVITIGCSSPEQNEDTVDNRTVEEINAERGDPCDCIESKIEVLDGFISDVKEGKYSTSEHLNKAFTAKMDGCMATLGHVEADLAWAKSLKECESFSAITDAMIEVKNSVLTLKENEQKEFLEEVDNEAAEVLNKLQNNEY
mgnify:CR=1 FL=1